MKKNILFSLFLFLVSSFSNNAPAQTALTDFRDIDKHAKKAKSSVGNSIQSLAKYLTKKAKTEEEQVRSFYIWITHNIAYDEQKYSKLKRVAYQINNREEFREKLVEKVLRTKKAVCKGYAALFHALCKEANIPSFVVVGYTKNQIWKDPITQFERTSHAWNVVKIGGDWKHIDNTWGSGTFNPVNKQFKKAFKEDFFLPDPTIFLETHLPADPMWQMVHSPINLTAFRNDSLNIEAHLTEQQISFNYRDSISAFEKLPKEEQVLQTAIHAHRANPKFTEKLGIAYFNYANVLSKQLKNLPKKVPYKDISKQYKKLIQTRKKAIQFLKEGAKYEGALVKDYISFGNALTKDLRGLKRSAKVKRYKAKLKLYKAARKILLETEEKNSIVEYSLRVCESGIEMMEQLLRK